MFIERSSARIRTVRTLFVLLGLMPCAGLGGWAVLRHSAAHREAIERRCGALLGMPVRIGRVEHLRPDVVRLRECVLSSPAGDDVLAVPVIDVESSATEVRVSLGRVIVTPQLARATAALAQQWLRQPARFPLDWVVDVGDVAWSGSDGPGAPAEPRRLRVECVAGDGSRAVRISRSAPGDFGASVDEVRLIATTASGSGEKIERSDVRLDLAGSVVEPVPVAVLEACAGLDAGTVAVGDDAIARGRIDCTCQSGQWSGTAHGLVERVDLAALHLPYELSGEARLSIDRMEWTRGRITALAGGFAATRGVVEQRLLETLVSAVGCRPGPAYRTVAAEAVRAFDEAAGRVQIGTAGLSLRGAPGRSPALAVVRETALVEVPSAAVPLERLAWLVSPPAAAAVPASRATGWLLGLFSEELLSGEQGGAAAARAPSAQAERPGRRSGF